MRGRLQAALLLIFLLLVSLIAYFPASAKTLSANAASGDVMTIHSYDIDMTIQTDRRVVVKEQIVMTANERGSEFVRSLPIEGNRYLDMRASCVGETGYEYYVDDYEDYLELVCRLETPANTTRTYTFSYTMISGREDVKNGMQIDVVGFGWTVPLHNVSVTMHFPERADIQMAMIARYGSSTQSKDFSYQSLSQDGKTLTLRADVLDRYTNAYNERAVEGVYVRFALPEGTLDSFLSTQLATDGTWIVLLVGVATCGLAMLVAVLCKRKREIITTVNITAPDAMDPMKMGKLLDGNVDNEDITSMIYYFAHKGYLSIDLSDEKNPAFTRLVDSLPESASVHEKSLFEGLFQAGETTRVSDLKEKFYKHVDKAKKQLLTEPMYEKKSVFFFLLGGILGALTAFFLPFILGKTRIGGGYGYIFGVVLIVPIIAVWVMSYIRENYRYKWKKGKQIGMFIAQIIVFAAFAALFVFAFAPHIMTRWEKLYFVGFVMAATFMTLGNISRTEKYVKTLGHILGFKDFIVYTEADKIQYMLRENPTLYYKVLPYAQVLGVTDEWEDKFKGILLQPPDWCRGNNMTVFDYIIINRMMRRSMLIAMSRPEGKGGSYVGRGGGGGSFGGFGGGGFGGGGGSWR